MDKETVNTPTRILSAIGSRTLPKYDIWLGKLLAMKPSS
jgi:hypothetical protein